MVILRASSILRGQNENKGMMCSITLYLIVCELCVTCFVWNYAYFLEYIIDMINDYTDKLSLHILLWEHMTC
jgi:hypothetical protein